MNAPQPAKPLATEATPRAAADARSGTTLVLGLGNDILTDDAVGLVAARLLRQRLGPRPDVECVETTEMGLSLLDFISGHRRLLVIDAVQTGRAPAGAIHEVNEGQLRTLPGMSPHFLGVGEILALGRVLGAPMPETVRILAVEVADPYTLGTALTPALEAALPQVVARAEALIAAPQLWDG